MYLNQNVKGDSVQPKAISQMVHWVIFADYLLRVTVTGHKKAPGSNELGAVFNCLLGDGRGPGGAKQ
jgi:hypothetical protein